MGERSGAPSGFSPASIVISKPPVAVQLPQPDVSANRDAPQLEVVRAILETNLIGPFALSQGIIALMRDQGHVRVVSVTSAMGQLSDMGGGERGFRLAAVGINGMTKIFAEELRGTDVLVNSVDPGWVRTRSPNATRSIEEGVATTVWLATLPEGGPSGQFFRDKQPLPW